MEFFVSLLTLGSQQAMIFGGAVPYIPQYLQIRKTKDAEGFSTFVCFVLSLANILRILFWYGKRFELTLLFQSIVMIATMLVMLQLCVTTKRRKDTSERRLWHFKFRYFWNWSHFSDYVMCLLLVSVLGAAATWLLVRVPAYLEVLGFCSLFTEAMLGTPQLARNFRHKSTKGMSVGMVCCWLSGDSFKTVFFIVRSSPVQFAICGIIQIGVDILILLQVFVYRERSFVTLVTKSKEQNISNNYA